MAGFESLNKMGDIRSVALDLFFVVGTRILQPDRQKVSDIPPGSLT